MDESVRRKEIFKDLIRRLHRGEAPDAVRRQVESMLGQIPYDEVVQSEQELIAEGMPAEEVIKLCDIHTSVLRGNIDQSAAPDVPAGHPVHTFKEENAALGLAVAEVERVFRQVEEASDDEPAAGTIEDLLVRFIALMDVDKHYRRKENLLFPFMERHGITAPPKVMWAKHDETRFLLKAALEFLREKPGETAVTLKKAVEGLFRPATNAIMDMIYKEDQLLLPMSMGTLSEDEWGEVARQSPEIGFCLYDPPSDWQPEGGAAGPSVPVDAAGRITLSTGSLSVTELTAMLNALPGDITFVDAEDRVRYFSQGRERIFDRNRAIIGRSVQLCHPPKSVHIVEGILGDFRSGKEERAAFWIEMKGRFIHIEYLALRGSGGAYLGCLEFTQDLTEKRTLAGERRLLQYR